MRQEKQKKIVLDHLKQMPIIEAVCKRSGIGRTTFYRWKRTDKTFAKKVDEAICEGESLVTDLSETQLISLIREKNFPALQLWLRAHHPKYSPKLEIKGKITNDEEPMTKKEAAMAKAALKMVAYYKNNDANKNK